MREAARRIHRSPETVRRWIWSGRLQAAKRGNTYYVDVMQLEGIAAEMGITWPPGGDRSDGRVRTPRGVARGTRSGGNPAWPSRPAASQADRQRPGDRGSPCPSLTRPWWLTSSRQMSGRTRPPGPCLSAGPAMTPSCCSRPALAGDRERAADGDSPRPLERRRLRCRGRPARPAPGAAGGRGSRLLARVRAGQALRQLARVRHGLRRGRGASRAPSSSPPTASSRPVSRISAG